MIGAAPCWNYLFFWDFVIAVICGAGTIFL
jgi:hypothetical protein